jgi:hypothetical protein
MVTTPDDGETRTVDTTGASTTVMGSQDMGLVHVTVVLCTRAVAGNRTDTLAAKAKAGATTRTA